MEADGVPVKQYAEQQVMPFQSASTKQDLETSAYEYSLLSGEANNMIKLTLRDQSGKTLEQTVPRLSLEERRKRTAQLPPVEPFEFKLLPGNVAYVALNAFGNDRAADGNS